MSPRNRKLTEWFSAVKIAHALDVEGRGVGWARHLELEALGVLFSSSVLIFSTLMMRAVLDDRHPVAQLLHLVRMCEENRTVAPFWFSSRQLEELLLDERVQAARRLVEDNELGLVREPLDDADLLLVAVRQVVDLLLEVEVQSSASSRSASDGLLSLS